MLIKQNKRQIKKRDNCRIPTQKDTTKEIRTKILRKQPVCHAKSGKRKLFPLSLLLGCYKLLGSVAVRQHLLRFSRTLLLRVLTFFSLKFLLGSTYFGFLRIEHQFKKKIQTIEQAVFVVCWC